MAKSEPKPPETPEAMAALLSSDAPATEQKAELQPVQPAKATKATKASKPDELPKARMGQPCKLQGPNGKPCPGKLTDMSRVKVAGKAGKPGETRITLICSKCNQVQGQSVVQHID